MTIFTSNNEEDRMNPAGEIINKQSVRIKILGLVTALLIVLSLVLILANLNLAAIITAALSLVSGTYMFLFMLSALGRVRRALNEVTGMTVNQGEFISGFSHRIREPLNNLVILGELLSGTSLSEKQKDMVETLIASTTNMATTVNELTMQGAGRIAFEKRKAIRFNILSAIQNTVDMFRMGSPSDIIFIIESAEKEGPEVLGDPIV
ncbi:MAG: hypothetical protein IH591_01485, partial [Bacteroidales bacterium]|nr:hypothetical protein [Bacteroidales bacterium]